MIENLKEMFDVSRGNRNKAAQFVATHGIIPVDQITEDEWVELYDYYTQKHDEYGFSTTDFDSFKTILRHSFPHVNNLSKNLLEDTE